MSAQLEKKTPLSNSSSALKKQTPGQKNKRRNYKQPTISLIEKELIEKETPEKIIG